MFSVSCLTLGATTPDVGVLGAMGYGQSQGQVVRILVPWDIATNQLIAAPRHCFEQYLEAAKADGVRVEVSLNRDGPAPSVAAYTAAVTKLARLKAGDIAYLTAWNEPDNPAYLELPGPSAAVRAAQYFGAARRAFARSPVTLVAGDFASGVSRPFFDTYADHLGRPWPTLWAIHPYTDISDFEYYMWAGDTAEQAAIKAARMSKVRQLALLLRGRGAGTRIWINEISVDHVAERCPPPGVRVGGVTLASCQRHRLDPASNLHLPTFSSRIQYEAARFLDGSLETSLPGYLLRTGLPPLARYIYLRAWSFSIDMQRPDDDVLEIYFPTALSCALSEACKA